MSTGARMPCSTCRRLLSDCARLLHRINLHLQVTQRKDQIPIRLRHVGDDVNRHLAKLRIAQVEILVGNQNLAAVVVNAQSAQERLCEVEAQH